MTMRSSMLLFLMLACLNVPAVGDAQTKEGVAGIHTQDGILMAWNRPGASFTLEIKSKNIKPLGTDPLLLISVDNKLLQFTEIETSNFLDQREARNVSEKDVLERYANYEGEYYATEMGGTSDKKSRKFITLQERTWLSWKIQMPPAKKKKDPRSSPVTEQLFLTALIKNYVLSITGIVSEKDDPESVLRLMSGIASTLRVSPKPIDFKELQEKIRQQ